MNWDQIEGNWKQFKGRAKQQWGKLTDDQLEVIAGKREQLVGRIQEVYGTTKEASETQVKTWLDQQRHAVFAASEAPRPPAKPQKTKDKIKANGQRR